MKRAYVTVALLAGILVLLLGIVALDRIVLDPGGGGMAREANRACASHNGVAVFRAQEGVIVCRDGWAVE